MDLTPLAEPKLFRGWIYIQMSLFLKKKPCLYMPEFSLLSWARPEVVRWCSKAEAQQLPGELSPSAFPGRITAEQFDGKQVPFSPPAAPQQAEMLIRCLLNRKTSHFLDQSSKQTVAAHWHEIKGSSDSRNSESNENQCFFVLFIIKI